MNLNSLIWAFLLALFSVSAFAVPRCGKQAAAQVMKALKESGLAATIQEKSMFQEWRGMESWEFMLEVEGAGRWVNVTTLDQSNCETQQFLAYATH